MAPPEPAPLDQRQCVCDLVASVTADVKVLLRTEGKKYYDPASPFCVTAVFAPTDAQMENLTRRVTNVRAWLPRFLRDFIAWKETPECVGQRVVMKITKDCFPPVDPFVHCNHFKVPGHTLEAFKQWYQAQNQCELFSAIVATVLQVHIGNGSAPVHTLANGTLLELVDVDLVKVCAKMAFSGLLWHVEEGHTKGGMTATPPQALKEEYNHKILRLAMRNPDTYETVNMWCDPTARQVALNLPLTVDVKLFEPGALPEEYTKYKPPCVSKLNADLDQVVGVNAVTGGGGKCFAARIYGGLLPIGNQQGRGAINEVWKGAQELVEKHAPSQYLHWDDAKEDCEGYCREGGRDEFVELKLDKPRSALATVGVAATTAAVASLAVAASFSAM